jgi:hypothetical protein
MKTSSMVILIAFLSQTLWASAIFLHPCCNSTTESQPSCHSIPVEKTETHQVSDEHTDSGSDPNWSNCEFCCSFALFLNEDSYPLLVTKEFDIETTIEIPFWRTIPLLRPPIS